MKRKIIFIVYCIGLLIALLYRGRITKAFALMMDQNLKGTVIVLDAGHGGNDPGARVSGQDEDEINLDLVLKLADCLEKAGAEVRLTRTEDVDLSDEGVSNIKRSDLQHRAEILNAEDVTLFISIHCNTSGDQRCQGSQVYYRINDKISQQLADTIQLQMKEVTGSKYIPASGDFYLLNETDNLGVLVEVGFLTNIQDLTQLKTEDYREELAFSIYKGISQFLEKLF